MTRQFTAEQVATMNAKNRPFRRGIVQGDTGIAKPVTKSRKSTPDARKRHKQGSKGEEMLAMQLRGLKPTTSCVVCGKEFYASPGHLIKGWGNTCSFECRSLEKPNGRFIENDVVCKNCGKSFHVKQSQEKNGKGKIYCSVSCRKEATQVKKVCEKCKTEIIVPKSHAGRVRFCSKECHSASALYRTANCKCSSCGKEFYLKASAIKRGEGAGAFCSVGCMTKNKSKIKLDDGLYASYLEVKADALIKSLNLDSGMIREHRFHETRKWRFDFAWPDKKIAMEVHGGIWLGKSGGHTSGKGRARDMEKMNAAVLLGWRMLEITANHLKNGKAAEWLKAMLTPEMVKSGRALSDIQLALM